MVTRSSRTGQGVLVHILNVSGTQISEVLPGLTAMRNLVCGVGVVPSATQGKVTLVCGLYPLLHKAK